MLRYACLLLTSSTAPGQRGGREHERGDGARIARHGVLELSSAGAEVGASDEGETGASEETAAAGLLSSVLSASDVVAAAASW